MKNRCQCMECLDYTHKSDCSVHNEPAWPKGDCDCADRCGACGEELGSFGKMDHTQEICFENLVNLTYRRGIALKDIVVMEGKTPQGIRARLGLEPVED